MAPVTQLSIMMVESDVTKTKRIRLILNLSLYNLGSKPAWIDHINLNIESNSDKFKMVYGGRYPPEKLGHHLDIKIDFQGPFYPITIGPKSELALAPTFSTKIPGDDLKPKNEYRASVEIVYGGTKVSETFEFIIDKTKQELEEYPTNKIYTFSPIGINRQYQQINFGN